MLIFSISNMISTFCVQKSLYMSITEQRSISWCLKFTSKQCEWLLLGSPPHQLCFYKIMFQVLIFETGLYTQALVLAITLLVGSAVLKSNHHPSYLASWLCREGLGWGNGKTSAASLARMSVSKSGTAKDEFAAQAKEVHRRMKTYNTLSCLAPENLWFSDTPHKATHAWHLTFPADICNLSE